MPLIRTQAPARWRYEKLTGRTSKALRLAEEEAQRVRHTTIGSQHLLLGLVREGEGLAARVLRRHGVELDAARNAVSVRGEAVGASLELTLARARTEAQELGHNFVGTEHLLLALLHEEHGIGLAIVEGLGADSGAVATELRAAVSTSGPKDNVVTCRVDDHALDAIDALVQAGIRSTRSDATAWLIRSGIEANHEFFEQVYSTVGEIRRLREKARAIALDN